MKWQDVSKILAGMNIVGVVGLFAYLFLLTGMDYTHSGDSNCTYIDRIYQCNAFINVSTKYWNFEFEHLDNESYIYLPSDLNDFTGKLTRYKAGDLDFVPVLYKKSTYGRKLWINLNQIENIIDTQPNVKVDWMVPARGKDNWRPVKEGDTWDRLKNNRIKLIAYPENEFDNIKWSFVIGEVNIDPIWYSGVEYNTKRKTINDKEVVEIKFDLNEDYNIKEEAEKKELKAKDYMNLKKTKYHGDVDIKLMHYMNVTTNQSYSCNCRNETIEYPANETNKTEAYNVTNLVCDTCYKNVTNEIFQEIDPETFILKNNEPIYEVFGDTIQFEELPDGGWGYSVWTDVTIMGVEVENASWANATFVRRKPVEVDNNDIEIINYSFKWIVEYDSDMLLSLDDLRFTNSTETSLPYWIKEINSGVNATVWIKDPNLLVNSTNTTYYMYYDNASVVSSESSFNDAFHFADNCDSDIGWSVSGGTPTWTTYDSRTTITLDADAERMSISFAPITRPLIIEVEQYFAGSGNIQDMLHLYQDINCGYECGTKSGYIGDCYTWGPKHRISKYISGSATWGIVSDSNTLVRNTWIPSEMQIYTNGTIIYDENTNILTTSESTVNSFETTSLMGAATPTRYIDWIRIRPLLSPTPTYSFGAEETSGPTIEIDSPTNTTYDTTSVDLNWTNSTEMDWLGYSLNGAGNITLTTNITMTAIEGSNHVIIWGNDTNGVMTSDEEWFTVMIFPIITIESPTNTTYTISSIDLNWSADETLNWSAYSLNGGINVTLYDWCYQESANVSTDCGGLDTGSYSWYSGANDKWRDGIWDTSYTTVSATNILYVNYTILTNANNESVVEIRYWHYDYLNTLNRSILSTCWDYSIANERTLQLKFHRILGGRCGTLFQYCFMCDCYNGVTWDNAILKGGSSPTSTEWDKFYEEAIWWDMSYNTTITAQEGSNTVTVWANDTLGNMNSSTVYFTVDTPPTVSWNYPNDDSWNTSRTFDVGFTPIDNTALDNCTLRDNRSGIMADTVTNTSALVNDSVNTIAETFTTDGHYNISIKCWDTNSNYAETVGRTIKVDTTPPTITIESPTNSTYNTKTVWFNVTSYDISGIDWCGYSLDGADNITMTNSSGNWNAQNTTMWDSYHEVVFSCNDTTGNINSTTKGFTSQYENVTRCTTLDAEGRTYYLRNDIIDSSTSECFHILAKHMTLDCQGHTIDGNDIAYHGILAEVTDIENITIKDCTLTDWDNAGIYMSHVTNNELIDVNISSCPDYGLKYNDISNFNITNSTFNNNGHGIRINMCNNGLFNNLTINNNDYGIYFRASSDNNKLTESLIENNSNYGIYFEDVVGYRPDNYYIYNNLFNNTNNYVDNYIPDSIYFNTTQQTGTRIHSSGVEIGGNYWTNSTGDDYSDTCTDADYNGFCDIAYTIDTGVYDYLPLSDVYGYINIVLPENTTYGTKDLTLNWTSTADVSDANYSLNGNSNITLMDGVDIKNTTLNSSQLLIGSNNIVLYMEDDNSDIYQLTRYFSLEANSPTWRNLTYDDLAILYYDNTITINVTDDYGTVNNVTVEHNGANYTGTNISDMWTITYNISSVGNVTDTIWMEDIVGNINSTTFTYNGADINITYANQSEPYMMPNATGYSGLYPMRYQPPITIFYNNGNGSDIYVNVTINTTVNSCLEFFLYNETILIGSVETQAHKFTSPSTTSMVVESMSNNTNISIYGWCDFVNCVSGNSYYYEYWFDFYNV